MTQARSREGMRDAATSAIQLIDFSGEEASFLSDETNRNYLILLLQRTQKERALIEEVAREILDARSLTLLLSAVDTLLQQEKRVDELGQELASNLDATVAQFFSEYSGLSAEEISGIVDKAKQILVKKFAVEVDEADEE